MLESRLFQTDSDIDLMREVIRSLVRPTTVTDFDETLQISGVRACTRLWFEDGLLAGFAFVDDYNNLMFEIRDGCRTTGLEDALVDWGIACQRRRNAASGSQDTLDASFSAQDIWQIALLERRGFELCGERSLRYERSLAQLPPPCDLPPGFTIHPVKGESEVEDLVALHRAAFGTDNMTVEYRLAMMHASQYRPDLDLVAVAPDGTLAAFCIGGIEDEERHIGYTDPIGTHPAYRRLGLAAALVSSVMHRMADQCVLKVTTGTSSANTGMQRLAESLGFQLVSETLWFSKVVA